MKVKAALIIILALSLSACCLKHQNINGKVPPIEYETSDFLKIKIINGMIVAFDEKGKVISKPVELPIKLQDKSKGFKGKEISGIENFQVLSIKGSCSFVMCNRGGCAEAILPDNHPLCPKP